MVFSSATFLFAFLPIVIAGYFMIKKSGQNIWLLLSSLVFYAWNEPRYLLILLLNIGLNYAGALWIADGKRKGRKHTGVLLWVVVLLNLFLLFYFKYFNFTIQIINDIFKTGMSSNVLLPIGISFFTFQSLSYVIDVWSGQVPAQKNIINFAMYVSMFPQLVAGPIVRYKDINQQIDDRQVSVNDFAEGLSRFIVGLFRKVIVADCLARAADGIFGLESGYRTAPLAWIGIIAYTLQIYFDFSGYSDMAIGLGRMLGFSFIENFNFPYISKSVTEFWRRWHISLSSFFRDYVYIPLGGNRKAVYRNVAIVFLLTGIWHGANYTFVIWGIWHGIFNILERPFRKKKEYEIAAGGVRSILGHIYTMMVVMIGWVFFRAENLTAAIRYLKSMFLLTVPAERPFSVAYFMHRDTWLILILALIWSTPLFRSIGEKWRKTVPENVYLISKYICLVAMLALCMLRVAAGTYSAFIYFQF